MQNTMFRSRRFAVAVILLLGASTAPGADVKRVSTAEAMSKAVDKPTPQYNQMAKQLHVSGAVEVNAFVTEEGKVERVEAVSGNPILVKCAEDALKRWKFTPFTEDGKPVKAVATLNFNFKL